MVGISLIYCTRSLLLVNQPFKTSVKVTDIFLGRIFADVEIADTKTGGLPFCLLLLLEVRYQEFSSRRRIRVGVTNIVQARRLYDR